MKRFAEFRAERLAEKAANGMAQNPLPARTGKVFAQTAASTMPPKQSEAEEDRCRVAARQRLKESAVELLAEIKRHKDRSSTQTSEERKQETDGASQS